MRYRAPVASALFLAFIAGGCGGEANPVPDVEGKRLDVAEELLDDAGLGYEVIGGGDLGVIVTFELTRALSFLAVGAVLLLGGFFMQRASARAETRLLRP